jgi:hypothetical protein
MICYGFYRFLHTECMSTKYDRLYGLVARVSDYRSRGPGLDSRPYQISWVVRGLERGPLNLVRPIEELLEWKSRGSSLENRDCRPSYFVALITQPPLPQKLALTSPTSGGRSVGIVRLRTKATEFSFMSTKYVASLNVLHLRSHGTWLNYTKKWV